MIPGDKVCGCCGKPAREWIRGLWGRCQQHAMRNPCAIEGCRRTTPTLGRVSDSAWLCGDHWRRFVPPRSRMRRTYHAHFRRAKRHGWTDESAAKYWRFWSTLIAVARRRAVEGRVDQKAIAELFGWEVGGDV